MDSTIGNYCIKNLINKKNVESGLALVFLFTAWVDFSQAKTYHHSYASNGSVTLTTPEPHNALEHNNRGYELGSKGLWPQAIKEHEEALSEDPYNKQFRTNLSAARLHYGDVLMNKHDYYGAMNQYREALYVDPTNLPADQNLDLCIKKLGKDPDNVKVRENMADEADISNNYPVAIVEYRKCVKMVDNGPMRLRLGKVLLKQDKVEEGYLELRSALTKDWNMSDKKEVKELAECHYLMGNILKEHAKLALNSNQQDTSLKRLLNASIEFRRACTLVPNYSDAIRGLLDVARQALSIKPSFNNHLLLGGAYLLSGDFEHSRLEYSQCWKLEPNNPDLAKARRVYYLCVVKSPLASPQILSGTLEKVQASLRQNPNDAELIYIFGRGKEALGDKSSALKAYQIAYKINPYVNPDLVSGLKRLGDNVDPARGNSDSSLNNAGSGLGGKPQSTDSAVNSGNNNSVQSTQDLAQVETKIRSNDFVNAKTQLNSILEKNPTNGKAWYLLGLCNEKQGNLDEAASAYRTASNFKEPNADSSLKQLDIVRIKPLLDQVEAAKKQGNWIEVSSTLREAIILAPNMPMLHEKLAEALTQLGDTQEAAKEKSKALKLEKK